MPPAAGPLPKPCKEGVIRNLPREFSPGANAEVRLRHRARAQTADNRRRARWMQREPIQCSTPLRNVKPRQQPDQLGDCRRTRQRSERGQGFVTQRGITGIACKSGEYLCGPDVVFAQRADSSKERGRGFFGRFPREHRRKLRPCFALLQCAGHMLAQRRMVGTPGGN